MKFISFLFFQDISFVNLQHENSVKNNVCYLFSLDNNWTLSSKYPARESTSCDGFRGVLLFVSVYAFLYLLSIQRWQVQEVYFK